MGATGLIGSAVTGIVLELSAVEVNLSTGSLVSIASIVAISIAQPALRCTLVLAI